MDVVNRTFIGISVPPQIAENIQREALLLKRKPGADQVRWSGQGEYLIQLGSLGELGLATLSKLKEVLPPIVARFPRTRLQVQGFGGHPNLLQPRFVHAEVVGDVALLDQLSQALDQAISPYVPAREVRGFRPQINVGRLKAESEQLRVALGRALKHAQPADMGVIPVDAVDLLISQASPAGIGYAVIERMPLSG